MYDDVKDQDFIIIAVAEESRGAQTAREFIDEAKPTYVTLIDREHHVADLYNMVNVPQSVWIDEHGRIVRPTETAGSHDSWRAMNREDMSLPDESAAIIAKAQETYVNAVRDWAINGAASKHVFNREQARAHLQLPDANVALANANFRLGRYLHDQGKTDEAAALFKTASDLRPESWNIYRQAMNLKELGPMGLAADQGFFERVDALGSDRYYPPPDIEGFPTELGFQPPD
ncbi:MAG: TlpA family protein disulfide reductase [Proteobacteria bacterium]|nr:MAG: TlpA family protein disulfide reductase [Pseudomonadota bacterium]